MPEGPVPGGVVRRSLAERLEAVVATVEWGAARLVLVVAEDSGSAVRACREVLGRLPVSWRQVWQPAHPAELVQGLHGEGPVPMAGWTVIWLGAAEQQLLPGDPELAEIVAASLRGALQRPELRPLLVLGTAAVHPQRWQGLLQPPASGGRDRWAQTRELLRLATVLSEQPPWTGVAEPGWWQPGPVTSWVAAQEAAGLPAAAPEGAGAAGLAPATPPGPLALAGTAAPAAEQPATPVPAADAVRDTGPAADGQTAPGPVEPGAAAGSSPAAEPSPAGLGPTAEPAPAAGPEQVPGLPVARPDAGLVRLDTPPPGPEVAATPQSPEAIRELGRARERDGELSMAQRLYERAAMAGDLAALADLGRLRSATTSAQEMERLYAQAVDERNAGVLFSLAAAGHAGALRTLRVLLSERERQQRELAARQRAALERAEREHAARQWAAQAREATAPAPATAPPSATPEPGGGGPAEPEPLAPERPGPEPDGPERPGPEPDGPERSGSGPDGLNPPAPEPAGP